MHVDARRNSSFLSVLSFFALLFGAAFAAHAAPAVSVLTYHNDNTRQGQNTEETVLTTANVNAATFGRLGFYSVDGKVDAEPLYVPAETIAGAIHNVLYVVTEHDSAYAFDADTGKVLWKVSALGSGESSANPGACDQVVPEIGITSTPVIDPKAGKHGTLFLVAASEKSGTYYQRLHALDLTTGAEVEDSPVNIQASYPGDAPTSVGGKVAFNAKSYNERAALLLLNGTVYLSWSSHCDELPYNGWIMGYDETRLTQTAVLNLTPNGSEGSIWQAGAGPAADASGNIYFLDANGSFDTTLNAQGFPSKGDFGNAFVKLSTAGHKLAVADYFAMSNTVAESNIDQDLGSGGAMLLPDIKEGSAVYQLAVGAGKDKNVYVVNRNNMGKFSPSRNSIIEEVKGALGGGEYGMPAYWNNTVYYGAAGDMLRAFSITGTAESRTSHYFPYPGVTPGISSNGTSNGIVWAIDESNPATLYAYEAANLSRELYDSNQAAGGRDHFGAGNKFITPMIANGKVFVATQNGIAVFGLLK